MRRTLFLIIYSLATTIAWAQPSTWGFGEELLLEEKVPDDLLARKSIVLHDPTIVISDLETVQEGFRRIGIDAVVYYPIDIPKCNEEVNREFIRYLDARNIKFMILLTHKKGLWDLVITPYNGTPQWFTPGQSAWHVAGSSLPAILESMGRVTQLSQKKRNLLVNPLPELELNLNPVEGNRNDWYAIDLKVDQLAIVKTGDKDFDAMLEDYFGKEYPFRHRFFEPGTQEPDIRSKGCLYSLKWIHTRASAAMDLLGYDMSKVSHAVSAISYAGGPMEVRTYSSEEPVWKFYFMHLENRNLFLGSRWDGDPNRLQALGNHVRGLKAELKVVDGR
jgi:hypothetical protein